jgi:hypothetical protein
MRLHMQGLGGFGASAGLVGSGPSGVRQKFSFSEKITYKDLAAIYESLPRQLDRVKPIAQSETMVYTVCV